MLWSRTGNWRVTGSSSGATEDTGLQGFDVRQICQAQCPLVDMRDWRVLLGYTVLFVHLLRWCLGQFYRFGGGCGVGRRTDCKLILFQSVETEVNKEGSIHYVLEPAASIAIKKQSGFFQTVNKSLKCVPASPPVTIVVHS
ncbi:hypothetical protein TNCV_2541511 [Trichonephila clavipes]|nr:hypothetical protein TNCV_2541511 [Trichonephila clavipes]